MLGAVLGVVHAAELRRSPRESRPPPQLEVVRGLGCDAGQGFLFAAPAPADELERVARFRGAR